MREFGPWLTNDPSHMKRLGQIVLAFTLRADADLAAENKGAEQGERTTTTVVASGHEKKKRGLFDNVK